MNDTESRHADGEANSVLAATWRLESGRLVARLLRVVRDVALAEDLAQEAFTAALEQWPAAGVPANPGGWLLTVARRRAVDHFRRQERQRRKQEELLRNLGTPQVEIPDLAVLVDHIDDDVLRLMFVTCHPAVNKDARIALTLRLLGGLTTEEIARSFLVKPATVGQRISRAKRTLADVGVPLDLPTGAEREARLGAVMEVVYLIFNEGYTATSGEDWLRPALCDEARRLARMLASIAAHEPEAHGLLALLDLQASRLPARVGEDGVPVLLADQDRRRWDHRLIRSGVDTLQRAKRLAARGASIGPYVLQAEIASCHARSPSVEDTDWPRIARLYDGLVLVLPSPVVEINRAVAHGMAFGPEAGLTILERLGADATVQTYHLLPSVRGDLLSKLGRSDEAGEQFRLAASLTRNERERRLLLSRAESG